MPDSSVNSTAESTANLPAVVQPPARGELVQTLSAEMAQSAETWMSFPVETPEDQMVVLNALADADDSAKSQVGKVLSVVGAVAKHDVRRNEHGELEPTVVCVLILEDGSTVATTGVYVRKFMGHLWLQFGHRKWSPPIKITLQLKELGTDRTAIKAKLAEPYVPAATEVPRVKRSK